MLAERSREYRPLTVLSQLLVGLVLVPVFLLAPLLRFLGADPTQLERGPRSR